MSEVLPFLNNINDEVSSNQKDKVATMMASVPNIYDSVTQYASHCLHANLQFSAIANIIQSIKTDPSIIYMVPDHKQCLLDKIFGGIG